MNRFNLGPTNPTLARRLLFTIFAAVFTAGLWILLDGGRRFGSPFWRCTALLGAWAVTTLLQADIRVTGGELIADWFRPQALRPLATNWSCRHVRWLLVLAKSGENRLARNAR